MPHHTKHTLCKKHIILTPFLHAPPNLLTFPYGSTTISKFFGKILFVKSTFGCRLPHTKYTNTTKRAMRFGVPILLAVNALNLTISFMDFFNGNSTVDVIF